MKIATLFVSAIFLGLMPVLGGCGTTDVPPSNTTFEQVDIERTRVRLDPSLLERVPSVFDYYNTHWYNGGSGEKKTWGTWQLAVIIESKVVTRNKLVSEIEFIVQFINGTQRRLSPRLEAQYQDFFERFDVGDLVQFAHIPDNPEQTATWFLWSGQVMVLEKDAVLKH